MAPIGADPDALLALAGALERAATDLRVARLAVDDAFAAAGEHQPADMPAVADAERWAGEQASDLRWRVQVLSLTHPLALAAGRRDPVASDDEPSSPPFRPQDVGDCDAMHQGVGRTLDELITRAHQARQDAHNLRARRPRGPFSFGGHLEQFEAKQNRLRKQLPLYNAHRCPDSLTIAVAQQYANLDLNSELGWPRTAAPAYGSAGVPPFHVHVDRLQLAAAIAGALAALAAIASAPRRALLDT